jgi:hypothetical protein
VIKKLTGYRSDPDYEDKINETIDAINSIEGSIKQFEEMFVIERLYEYINSHTHQSNGSATFPDISTPEQSDTAHEEQGHWECTNCGDGSGIGQCCSEPNLVWVADTEQPEDMSVEHIKLSTAQDILVRIDGAWYWQTEDGMKIVPTSPTRRIGYKDPQATRRSIHASRPGKGLRERGTSRDTRAQGGY